ncbi:MAG: glycosyltransferase family 2 protein, partial [Alistipes sp.]|nr:glycosyltransferase family 2 protein [Alistipes sp.]
MLRLTLLIPTFNRSRELLRALRSVAEQRLDPALWECVIVDNNSTDDTA